MTTRRRALRIIGIIVLLALAVAIALTDHTGATTLAGNRGGCSVQSRRYDLVCTVQDAGVGWVSGSCTYGEWFLAQTARTFVPGEPVTATGCVDDTDTLHSAPGTRWRTRITPCGISALPSA